MTGIFERLRARFYIHIKQNKLRNVFIHKKSDTCQKGRQFLLRCYSADEKSDHVFRGLYTPPPILEIYCSSFSIPKLSH